jgi:hypothetical protein
MQFNYQNVKVEEENQADYQANNQANYQADYRTYGFLNKNIVNDEQEYNKYIIEIMNKRIKLLEESNKVLESVNKEYINDINVLTKSLHSLQTEFSNKLIELENKNKKK